MIERKEYAHRAQVQFSMQQEAIPPSCTTHNKFEKLYCCMMLTFLYPIFLFVVTIFKLEIKFELS
jgi:hypothetical protein